jgi:hypothetical protein
MPTKKIRKQIYIEARQEQLLKQLVKETGSTEARYARLGGRTGVYRAVDARGACSWSTDLEARRSP